MESAEKQLKMFITWIPASSNCNAIFFRNVVFSWRRNFVDDITMLNAALKIVDKTH
jgi:hypothetical protein